MDLGIAGRRALVLASSRGLGLAIAKRLDQEGAKVMICGRDPERLRAAREALGGEATSLATDLATLTGIDAALDHAEATYGGVDILVANCGGPPMGGALEFDAQSWRAQFEAMVLVPIHAAQRLVPAMVERRWGRIVAVTASTVTQPMPGLALSNTLRAGLANWCKTLSAEIAASGVTVNTLVPGRISTARIAELNAAAAARSGLSPEAVQADAVAGIPAGRDGEAEEFAAAAAFLASEQAAYVTGSALRVDGGLIKTLG